MSIMCSYDAYQSMVEPTQHHLLVQWGITRGALQEASLPKEAIKKHYTITMLYKTVK